MIRIRGHANECVELAGQFLHPVPFRMIDMDRTDAIAWRSADLEQATGRTAKLSACHAREQGIDQERAAFQNANASPGSAYSSWSSLGYAVPVTKSPAP